MGLLGVAAGLWLFTRYLEWHDKQGRIRGAAKFDQWCRDLEAFYDPDSPHPSTKVGYYTMDNTLSADEVAGLYGD